MFTKKHPADLTHLPVDPARKAGSSSVQPRVAWKCHTHEQEEHPMFFAHQACAECQNITLSACLARI